MVTWTDNSGTGTATSMDTFVQVFNTIYDSNVTGGTETTSNVILNSAWGSGYPDSRVQYIYPRIVSNPNVPTNSVYIYPGTVDSGTTDTTFTIRQPWETNTPWATNVEVAPANTWITIGNDQLDFHAGAINQQYHYILRFLNGQWKWEDALPGQKKATYRSKLKAQMFPFEQHRNDVPGDFYNVQENEIVALQLLKSMVSPERWRKYLKYGFVDVQGKSGLVYQILRKHSHVRVFRQGEKIAELCVGLKNRYEMPPTDEVITRMIIVECDEPDIWKRANAHGFTLGKKPQSEEDLARIVLQKAA